MPQMSPLMWFAMMNITIMTLMIISTMNYYTQKPMKPLMTKIKTTHSNWKW